MKTSVIIIVFSFLSINLQKEKDTFKERIIGKWDLVKEEDDSETDLEIKIGISPSDENSSKMRELTLNFYPDNRLDYVEMGSPFKTEYRIIDSTLMMGNRSYKILSLTKKELVMFSEDLLYNTTFHYEKSK